MAGWFSGATDFDGGPGTATLTSANHAAGAATDIFLAKYDRDSGAFRWARGVGGTVTDQTLQSITAGLVVDDDGCSYVTGQLYGTDIRFYDATGPQAASPVWASSGNNDSYVIKYDRDGNLWQPTALQTWREQNWSTMANSGPSADAADPDADRTANLIEYAIGTLPDSAVSRPNMESQISNSKFQITFTPQIVSGLTYMIEASDDLASWTSTDITPSLTSGMTHTHTDSVDLTAGTKRFLRLKVTQ